MKIDRKELTDALTALVKIIAPRPTLPIIECVAFGVSPDGKRLILQATDLDSSVVCELALSGEGTAPFAVNGKLLLQVVKKLPKSIAEVEFQVTLDPGAKLTVPTSVTVHGATLPVLSMADFPVITQEAGVNLSTPGLIEAFEKVAVAMSTDETRYGLNGVNLDVASGAVVATDGHRMHVAQIQALAAGSSIKPMLIPRTAVIALISPALRKLALDAITVQMVGVNDPGQKRGGPKLPKVETPHTVTFHLRNGCLKTRLVDAQFPNYAQVMPDPTQLKVRIIAPKAALAEALDRVATVASQKRDTPAAWLLEAGAVQLYAVGEESDRKITVNVPGATYTGTPGKPMWMNARYLMGAIAATVRDTIVFAYTDHLSPGLVAEDGLSVVIMPMRGEAIVKVAAAAPAATVQPAPAAEPVGVVADETAPVVELAEEVPAINTTEPEAEPEAIVAAIPAAAIDVDLPPDIDFLDPEEEEELAAAA